MPGYDKCRFIDLSPSFADEFSCGVCLGIYRNPMVTQCEHTFCHDCITKWFASCASNDVSCPECRHSLTSAPDRPILRHPFRKFGNLLDALRVRCDYAERGCDVTPALGALETHVKHECAFNVCKCRLRLGPADDHNCLQLLRRELDKMIDKNEKLVDEKKSLFDANRILVHENQSLYDKNRKLVYENESLIDANSKLNRTYEKKIDSFREKKRSLWDQINGLIATNEKLEKTVKSLRRNIGDGLPANCKRGRLESGESSSSSVDRPVGYHLRRRPLVKPYTVDASDDDGVDITQD